MENKGVQVLILDNVQAMNAFYGIDKFRCVIVAFSPGAKVKDSMSKFKKIRGDGTHQTVYFHPLDVQYSKQVFQNHGCTISDEESTPESTSTSKQLTNKDFMEYFYYTGGVPRYLSWIARLKEY